MPRLTDIDCQLYTLILAYRNPQAPDLACLSPKTGMPLSIRFRLCLTPSASTPAHAQISRYSPHTRRDLGAHRGHALADHGATSGTGWQ